MIIDTHVHLDLKQYKKDLDEVIKRAKYSGVEKMIIPGISSSNMKKIIEICETNNDIFFASGNHPNYVGDFDIEEIEKNISHPKCIAIGECGLDWFRIPKDASVEEIKEKQIKVFQQQIELSIKHKLPLILHSRDTDDDMIEVLESYGDKLYGGVIHCYVGSEKLLSLSKYNFYFGIGGVVTYKNAKELRANILKVPLDKLIIETDGPYLTPENNRGKRNEPFYTNDIVKEVSSLLNLTVKEVEDITYNNTCNLFNFV